MHDADDNERVVGHTEVSAIPSKDMKLEPWPNPVACDARDAEFSDAGKVGDKLADELFSCRWTAVGDVVVDAVEIEAGSVGDDELARLDGTSPC